MVDFRMKNILAGLAETALRFGAQRKVGEQFRGVWPRRSSRACMTASLPSVTSNVGGPHVLR
jgi:hypothetical protein